MYQRMGDALTIWVVHKVSSSSQTLPSAMILKVSWRAFPSDKVHVHKDTTIEL